ncbi:unnamed protein product [Blepharisma stoltei]|uniref:Cation/H+ exchanger domain-containing protein n=1 Tax=Blepharisma stoltei TaxID=1481888 RepID=A0AAU9JK97_9CILI|nr:unnamed protein product [Blepharisma stoltei]
MKVQFEVAFFVALTFLILYIGHISRNRNIKILQEKSYSLIFGIIFGLLFSVCQVSSIILDDYNFTLSLFYYALLPIILSERIFNCYKGFIYQEIGTILIFVLIGGIMFFFSTLILLCSLFWAIESSWNVTEAAVFAAAMYICGSGLLGLVKDQWNHIILQGESMFTIIFAFPLYLSIKYTNEITSENIGVVFGYFFLELVLSLGFGIIIGMGFTMLLKFSPASKVWDIIETAPFILVLYLSFILAEGISLSGPLALLASGLVLVKYHFINDLSRIVLANNLITLNACSEVLGYIIIGFYLTINNDYSVIVIVLVPFIIYFSRFLSVSTSYLFSKLCGLKLAGFKDLMSISFLSFKGIEAFTLFLLINNEFDNGEKILCFGKFGIAISTLISNLCFKCLSKEKDEGYGTSAKGLCLKIKNLLLIFDKFIQDFFYKENQDNSIMSPKFHESPQKFEPGIQQRQDRDETIRELQALNMNVTETEILSAFQLR